MRYFLVSKHERHLLSIALFGHFSVGMAAVSNGESGDYENENDRSSSTGTDTIHLNSNNNTEDLDEAVQSMIDGQHLVVLESTGQLQELQTILKDRFVRSSAIGELVHSVSLCGHVQGYPVYRTVNIEYKTQLPYTDRFRTTDHSDFVFYADRLMRLVIEEGLNRLPYTEITVTTPTGCPYRGTLCLRLQGH